MELFSRSKLKTRLIAGFGANAYGQAITIVIQLVSVPVLLSYWGAQLYGEWLILSAIPSYLSMANLGFSQSAANDMTSRLAHGDQDGALVIFQSLSAMTLTVVSIGLLVIGVMVDVLPLGHWMRFERLDTSDVRWVIWLLSASVLFQLVDGVNHAGFRANGEYALHSFLYWTTLLLQQVALWSVAALGYGPTQAAASMLIIRVFGIFATALLLFHRHKTLAPGFSRADVHALFGLSKPALANLGLPFASGISVQGMVLVVGGTLGALAVVTFSTIRTLARAVIKLASSVTYSFEPELAASFGENDPSFTQTLFLHNLTLCFWLGVGTVFILFTLGGEILSVWTSGKVVMDWVLFALLLVSSVAYGVWYVGISLLKAANRHLRATIWYTSTSAIAVTASAILLKDFAHLWCAGLCLLCIDFVMMVYLSMTVSSFVGMSPRRIVESLVDLRYPMRAAYSLALSWRHGKKMRQTEG